MVSFCRWINRVLGVALLGFAAFAGILAWRGAVAPPPLSQLTAPPSAVFNPEIRVRLSVPAAPKLRCDGRYEIRLLGTPQVLSRGERLAATELQSTPNGIRIGAQTLPATRLEIVPATSPAVWIGGHQYRGRLRIVRLRSGDLQFVNVLPLEEYLASVVDSEMPIAFGEQARRAQAIAARTYALYQMQQNRSHPYYDVFDSERSQRYQGVVYENAAGKLWAGESDSSRAVVAATAGVVCLHDDKLFCTYYSAACGGRTTPGRDLFSDAAPPLKSVDCDWCRESDLFRWTRTVPRTELQRMLASHDKAVAPTVRTISSVRDTPGDLHASRPTDRLTLGDGDRVWHLTHEVVRTSLPTGRLPSPLFRAELRGDDLVVEGRGHGHGVGLCQWGCRGQATAGRSAIEILATYYPGSRLVRLKAPTAAQH